MRADFYIIRGGDENRRLALLGSLLGKALSRKLTVALQVPDNDSGTRVETMLWNLEDSFLPSCHSQATDADCYPVVWQTDAPAHRDVVVNLGCSKAPAVSAATSRYADLVLDAENELKAARSRYRMLQKQAAEVYSHDID